MGGEAKKTLPEATGTGRKEGGLPSIPLLPPRPRPRNGAAEARIRPPVVPRRAPVATAVSHAPPRTTPPSVSPAVARSVTPDAPSASEAPAAAKWRMPAPYRLVRRLSPKLVFEGKNADTARRVTIQLVRGDDEDAFRARLGRAPELNHPNTARVLDVGVVAGPRPVGFIVREYVSGTSLAQLLATGPMPPRQATAIVWQVLDSLEEAHGMGIAHGRISPEHVLLATGNAGSEYRVKLVGYWSATAPSRSASGEFEACRATPADDVRETARLLQQCLERAEPSEVASAFDADALRACFDRALHDSAEQRFSTVADLRRALLRCERDDGAWTNTQRALLLGKPIVSSERRLLPSRNLLMSTRPVSIWVVEGDAALRTEAVQQALARLGQELPVRVLNDVQRKLAAEELRESATALPWVVIYGGLDVVLDDPLLKLLGSSVELTRLLISSHENLELLQDAIAKGGVDRHVALPCSSDEIVASVRSLVVATRRLNNHYDSIRLALREVRTGVDTMTHAIAAAAPAQDQFLEDLEPFVESVDE